MKLTSEVTYMYYWCERICVLIRNVCFPQFFELFIYEDCGSLFYKLLHPVTQKGISCYLFNLKVLTTFSRSCGFAKKILSVLLIYHYVLISGYKLKPIQKAVQLKSHQCKQAASIDWSAIALTAQWHDKVPQAFSVAVFMSIVIIVWTMMYPVLFINIR